MKIIDLATNRELTRDNEETLAFVIRYNAECEGEGLQKPYKVVHDSMSQEKNDILLEYLNSVSKIYSKINFSKSHRGVDYNYPSL